MRGKADRDYVREGWHFASHEEAWDLLAPRLTSSDLERFNAVATDVLGAVSPEFELPVEQRDLAEIRGKTLPHSASLRQGIARALALMGTHPGRAKNAEGAAYLPGRVVSGVLAGGHDGEGWRVWATLDGVLPVLAEAAPEAFLGAVERGLSGSCFFEELFAQEDGQDFYGARVCHAGLLLALERLAWSSEHFAQVAGILAHLAELDPGGGEANRPGKRLRDFFRSCR